MEQITLTKRELQEILTDAIEKAVQNPDLHCRYRVPSEQHDRDHYLMGKIEQSAEQHAEDHLLIRQYIRNMGKISDIKFAIVKWAVIFVLTAIAGWAGFGLMHIIRGE